MGYGTETRLFSTPDNNAVSTVHEFLGTPHGMAPWDVWKSEARGGGSWANGAPLTGQAIEEILESYPQPESIISERYGKVRKRLIEIPTDMR